MDIKEYIASGIVEQYVLGSVSSQERQEVECMSNIYPEIKTHLLELQDSIEKMATQGAVSPPKNLKAKVMAEITKTPQIKEAELDREGGNTKIISINNNSEQTSSRINKMRLIAAACLVGVVISTLITIYLSTTNNTLNNQLTQSEEATLEAKNNLQSLEQSYKYSTEQLAFITAENTMKINLKGTDGNEYATAAVFWNLKSKKVLLDKGKLPQLQKDQQYQLWAISDGVPVDMGILDWEKINLGFVEMKATENAQAFAITIEPIGGSEKPTLEQMIVLGEV